MVVIGQRPSRRDLGQQWPWPWPVPHPKPLRDKVKRQLQPIGVRERGWALTLSAADLALVIDAILRRNDGAQGVRPRQHRQLQVQGQFPRQGFDPLALCGVDEALCIEFNDFFRWIPGEAIERIKANLVGPAGQQLGQGVAHARMLEIT